MCFFASLFPATFFAVLGFFVLFAASRAQGGVQTFGRVLGIWVLILAAIPVLAGAYMTVSGQCEFGRAMQEMRQMHGQP